MPFEKDISKSSGFVTLEVIIGILVLVGIGTLIFTLANKSDNDIIQNITPTPSLSTPTPISQYEYQDSMFSASIISYRQDSEPNSETSTVFQISALSNGGQVEEIKLWADYETEPVEWQTFGEFKTIMTTNNENVAEDVFTRLKDAVGNESDIIKTSIMPESGPPPYED